MSGKPSSLKTTQVPLLCEEAMRLLPLTLLVVCCYAHAEWQSFVIQTDGKHLFADWGTVEKIGVTKRIWVLENYAEAENRLLSTTTLIEIHCREKKVRPLQQYWHTEHFGEGENITPKDIMLDSDGNFPRPQTALYKLILKVCKK